MTGVALKQGAPMATDSTTPMTGVNEQAVSSPEADHTTQSAVQSGNPAQPAPSGVPEAVASVQPGDVQLAAVQVVEVKEPAAGEKVEVQITEDEQLKLDFD